MTGNDAKEVWNSFKGRNQFFDCLGYVAFFRVPGKDSGQGKIQAKIQARERVNRISKLILFRLFKFIDGMVKRTSTYYFDHKV